MKYFIAFLMLSFCVAQFRCKTNQPKPTVYPPTIEDTICSPFKYLSVRMLNCPDAIVWMDSIIAPSEVVIVSNRVSKHPKLVEGKFNILGDTLSKFSTKNHLFYINKDCFVGQSCKNVFRVFCPENVFDSLVSVDSLNQVSKTKWKISLVHNGTIGLSFDCFDGIVVSSKYSKASTQ